MTAPFSPSSLSSENSGRSVWSSAPAHPNGDFRHKNVDASVVGPRHLVASVPAWPGPVRPAPVAGMSPGYIVYSVLSPPPYWPGVNTAHAQGFAQDATVYQDVGGASATHPSPPTPPESGTGKHECRHEHVRCTHCNTLISGITSKVKPLFLRTRKPLAVFKPSYFSLSRICETPSSC